MTRTSTRRLRRVGALSVAVAILLGACGDDDSGDDAGSAGSEAAADTASADTEGDAADDGADSTEGGEPAPDDTAEDEGDAGGETDAALEVFAVGPKNQTESGEPTEGGSFTFAEWVQPPTLDPHRYFVSGAIGGIVFAAIYDPLMVWDPETGEYSPNMAEALGPNEDFTVWTLTLRDGVTFTDGTAYDSEAVKYNIERAVELNAQNSDLITEFVASVDTPDPQTVVFNLTESWPDFPYLLSANIGYIGSPTAMEEAGEAFGTAPVGAGPFVLSSFIPQEEIVIEANPDYYDGPPHLKSVMFVPVSGELTRLDLLMNGDVDAAFFRGFEASQKAVEAGYPGYMNMANGGWILSMNHREGNPAHDVRVRQAIAHAIDPEVIKQRFLNGYGVAGSDLFLPWSRWHSDVHGPEYDPERASELLEEAKADGFDGKVSILYSASQDYALAVQAMLGAVGFDVELEAAATTPAAQTRVFVDYDFELYPNAMDMSDASVAVNLRSFFLSPTRNYSGVTDDIAEWEALIGELWAATDEEKPALMEQVQTLWNQTMPALPTSALAKYIAWDDSIHGVQPTLDDIVLLNEAWREN